MAKVIVTTDDGREVAVFTIPAGHLANSVWRSLTGRLGTPMGWLGRALSDAGVIEAGGDPERPSERAMRLATGERELVQDEEVSGLYGTGGAERPGERAMREARRDMAEAHAEGLHDGLPREGCPECEA
jgi:hypothetical protein